jgi:hypothetical protein
MFPKLARYLELSQQKYSLPPGIVAAFAACFTWDEACDALIHVIDTAYDVRGPIQKRVVRLAEAAPNEDALRRLVSQLLAIAEARIRLRRRVGAILWSLFRRLPVESQRDIVRYWKHGSTADSQDRWLKVVGEFDFFFNAGEICRYWRDTRHYTAAKLIAYKAPPEFVLQVLGDLIEHCSEGWIVSRAALRVPSLSDNDLRRIRRRFPVSYAYLCAKLGRPLSERFVIQTFIKEKPDLLSDNRPLLLWSVGHLGMWGTLEKLCARWPEIQDQEADYWAHRTGTVAAENRDLLDHTSPGRAPRPNLTSSPFRRPSAPSSDDC